MGESGLILGVSGLRGIVGESLTVEVAARYARVVGEWFCGYEDCAAVAVASDGRAGYEPMYEAVIEGLAGAGCHVTQLGVQMTPTVGWYVDRERLTGGVVVTASHNPAQWNGIKVLLREGEGRSASAPTEAQASIIVGRFRRAGGSEPGVSLGGVIHNVDWVAGKEPGQAHAVWVARRAGRRGTRACHSVALDSLNASGSRGAETLCSMMEAVAIQLAGDRSGVFPHLPEPTKENLSGEGDLCDAVPGLKADVGFAQDPDADRLAIVDEQGNYIGEEYTLVLAAVSLLEARESKSTSPVIVTNLSTSRMIDDVAAKYGARVVRTPVGEANVVERMKKLKESGENVILGGEGNGGVIWPEVVYVRDSLGAMALTLALMARTGKKVSELVAQIDSMAEGGERREGGGTGGTPVPRGGGGGGGGYTIIKRKVDIPSKDAAAPAVEAVRRACEGEAGAVVDLQDGVRVDWPAQRAWVHVRASNTEPIMRLIGEAPSEAEAQALLARIERMIAAGRPARLLGDERRADGDGAVGRDIEDSDD